MKLEDVLRDLEPETSRLCKELYDKAAQAGFPVVIVQGYRSSEAQDLIYQRGRTRPGEPCTHWSHEVRPVGTCDAHPLGVPVTNAPPGHSWHEAARAFDVAFKKGEKGISWDGPWERLGALGETLGLKWGGRWKVQDKPHFEYKGNFASVYEAIAAHRA